MSLSSPTLRCVSRRPVDAKCCRALCRPLGAVVGLCITDHVSQAAYLLIPAGAASRRWGRHVRVGLVAFAAGRAGGEVVEPTARALPVWEAVRVGCVALAAGFASGAIALAALFTLPVPLLRTRILLLKTHGEDVRNGAVDWLHMCQLFETY
eukprot:3837766-Pyramimonas_sp.AAC.1